MTARTIVAGVHSDRLYPLYQSRDLAAGIKGAGEAAVTSSPCGHDSFLIETPPVAPLIKSLVG